VSSAAPERAELLRRVRASLLELAAEGIDYLPRADATALDALPPAQPKPAKEAELAPASPAIESPADTSADTGARPADPVSVLQLVREDLGECTRCALHERRKHIVFGEGDPSARVVFVGEGPGADEDRTGRPFVGRAGELLDKMIEAVGWKREQVYICNIVKCRPPGNRTPELAEIASCRPFLERQLLTIRPAVIVALGKPATSSLLNRSVAITRVRGLWQEWNGIPVMPTFHPAYVLRQYTTETRQAVWDDLRAARTRVDETG